jgi:hypothetical protein
MVALSKTRHYLIILFVHLAHKYLCKINCTIPIASCLLHGALCAEPASAHRAPPLAYPLNEFNFTQLLILLNADIYLK